MTAALLGWGSFTWKRAEDAMFVARQSYEKVSKVELKMAEDYLTKKDFESYMNRLFDTLNEMKKDINYVSERVDYHVSEQTIEAKKLREELSRFKEGRH